MNTKRPHGVFPHGSIQFLSASYCLWICAGVLVIGLSQFGIHSAAAHSWMDGRDANAPARPSAVCPPSIGFGDTIQCSISSPGEKDTYTFNASAGDTVLVRMSESAWDLRPGISILGPDGTKLCENDYPWTVEIASCPLASTGTHSILVYDAFAGTGTGDYYLYLQRLNNPAGAMPIAYGQTLSSSITMPAAMATYTFTASAGDSALVRMSKSSGTIRPAIAVHGPDGSRLCETSGSPAAEAMCTLDSAGTHVILAYDEDGTGTGGYDLYAQLLDNPDTPVPISYGQTLTGLLVRPEEKDTYTFAASAGDKVFVKMSASSGNLWPGIRLLGPDGTKLCENSDFTTAEIASCTLASSGTYSILAYNHWETGTGYYVIRLQRLNDPNSPMSIAYGQTLSGAIGTPLDIDTYTFNATAGDKVFVKITGASGLLRPKIRAYDPMQTPVCEYDTFGDGPVLISGCALASTGTYSILAYSENGTTTGDYNLFLQRLKNPGRAVPIAYGETLSGSIATPGKMDTYTFAASAGDKVLVRMSYASGDIRPGTEIYSPDGTRLCREYSDSHCPPMSITSAGTYTFLVYAIMGSTGDYHVSLQRDRPASAVSIAYGQTLSDSIAIPAEMDTYTFRANAGDIVLVRMIRTSETIRPGIAVYGPNGTRLCRSSAGALETTAEITGCTLSAAGTYSILAYNAWDAGTGGYFIYMQRFNNPLGQVPIIFGQTLSGSITTPAEVDTYTFGARAGETVLVRMSKSSGSFWPGITVYGPDGTALCKYAAWYGEVTAEIAACYLPSTGMYSILAYDGRDAGTGDYSLYLQLLNNPDNPVPITLGVPQEFYLPEWFQLEVPSNTADLFLMLQVYHGWGGELRLYRDSQVLASTSGYTDLILQWPSPAPGTYRVQVLGSGSGRITAYAALPELPVGQWVVGSIYSQWGSAWYQFTVPPGQSSLHLRVETIGLWSQLKVYRGALEGTLVGSASGPSMNLDIPSPPPGTYYVHLTDSAWIQDASQTRDHMIRVDANPIEPPACTAPVIASFTPTKGGTAGPVTISIHGQCLDPAATVCLTRQGHDDVCATAVSGTDEHRGLAATFDLSTAAPGDWSPVVTNPDTRSVAAPTFFTVESGGAADLWVEIIGRDQIRVGRTATYIVRYGNRGTVDARHVFVAVGAPATLGFDVDVPGIMIDYAPWSGDSSDPSALYYSLIYASSLPAGAAAEFELRILSQTPTDPLVLYADITADPTAYLPDIPDDPLAFLGVPGETGAGSAATINWVAESKPPVDCSTEPPSGTILVFQDYPFAMPGKTGKFANHVAKSIGGGQYIEMVPGDNIRVSNVPSGGCSTTFRGAVEPPWWTPKDAAKVRLAAEKTMQLKAQGKLKDEYNGNIDEEGRLHGSACGSSFSPPTWLEPSISIKTNCMGFVEFLNAEFESGIGTVGTPWEWLGKELGEAVFGGKWEEEKLTPIKCEEKYARLLLGKGRKTLQSITSVSPEDKFGPSGYDAVGTPASQLKHWIPASQPLDYRIDFWNKEDAPAATVDVVIADTLDAYLDWSTFRFTEIGFLDWAVPLEPTQYFNVDVPDVSIDLSRYYPGQPTITMTVNVEGTFDPAAGTVRWEFHALDPVTREPPENPYAGFLPPITDSGWEIGWVNFSASPKPGLASGTVIGNQAFVKFDVDVFKPAPSQGPYINTLDAAPPTSAMSSPTGTQPCASFRVSWSGADEADGSGVGGFDVYADDLGDASPAYLWQSNTTTRSAIFSGVPGHGYGFYTRARDNAGNLEAAPQPLGYDAEVTAGVQCVNAYLPLIVKNK